MMKFVGRFVLSLFGWKCVGDFPYQFKKCIVIQAPHTSMWDFFLGRLGFFVFGVRVKFLIKKEMFRFPFGGILKALGGLPVDRGKRNNMVDYVAQLFDEYEELTVVITPEGTRKLTHNWKKGFYFIAEKAHVPIVLAYLNYKTKTGGVDGYFYPSGDFKKDFAMIEDFYRDKVARHPEKFNLTPKPEA